MKIKHIALFFALGASAAFAAPKVNLGGICPSTITCKVGSTNVTLNRSGNIRTGSDGYLRCLYRKSSFVTVSTNKKCIKAPITNCNGYVKALMRVNRRWVSSTQPNGTGSCPVKPNVNLKSKRK